MNRWLDKSSSHRCILIIPSNNYTAGSEDFFLDKIEREGGEGGGFVLSPEKDGWLGVRFRWQSE